VADLPRRSWRTWALVASLGLNLIFVGLIAGAMLKGPPPPPLPGIGQYARALPEPYRNELSRAARASRPDWPAVRKAWQGRRRALAEALTAEPFDRDSVAVLLDQDRQLAADLASRSAGLLLEEIKRMSPADRTRYAEALRENQRNDHRP